MEKIFSHFEIKKNQTKEKSVEIKQNRLKQNWFCWQYEIILFFFSPIYSLTKIWIVMYGFFHIAWGKLTIWNNKSEKERKGRMQTAISGASSRIYNACFSESMSDRLNAEECNLREGWPSVFRRENIYEHKMCIYIKKKFFFTPHHIEYMLGSVWVSIHGSIVLSAIIVPAKLLWCWCINPLHACCTTGYTNPVIPRSSLYPRPFKCVRLYNMLIYVSAYMHSQNGCFAKEREREGDSRLYTGFTSRPWYYQNPPESTQTHDARRF